MNYTWIIAAIVAVAAVVSGYYFFGEEDMSSNEDMAEESEDTMESRKVTLADLFFLGEDFRCEFSHQDEMSKSSGVAYLAEAGERMRVDFEVTESAGGPMSGSIIRKDNYSYLWSSAMEQGIKVAITEENRQDIFAGGQENTIDEDTEFDCVAWVENPTMFELPTGVEFMDMSDTAAIMERYKAQY